MSETLKKISDKIQGKPEARLMVGEDDDLPTAKRNIKEKLLGPNWIGKIREHVKGTVSFNGKTISDPEIKCPKCNATVNLNAVIDSEGGLAFATLVLHMDERGKLYKQWRDLEEKMHGMNLYSYSLEKEKLLNQFYRNEIQGTATSHLQTFNGICPHCFVPIGKIDILLELTIPAVEFQVHTYENLYALALKVQKEVAAKVAHELGHGSFEALRKWVENPALPELETVLKEFQTKFNELNAPDYLTDEFSKALRNLIDNVPKEIRRRKETVVNKIQTIAKLDAVGK